MNLWHVPVVVCSQCLLHSASPWADCATLRESCRACENHFTTGGIRNIRQTSVTAVNISFDSLRQIPTNLSVSIELTTVANYMPSSHIFKNRSEIFAHPLPNTGKHFEPKSCVHILWGTPALHKSHHISQQDNITLNQHDSWQVDTDTTQEHINWVTEFIFSRTSTTLSEHRWPIQVLHTGSGLGTCEFWSAPEDKNQQGSKSMYMVCCSICSWCRRNFKWGASLRSQKI